MDKQNFFLGEEAKRDLNKFYEVTNVQLGKGTYGVVVLSRLKGTKIERAIKVIDKAKVSNVERFKLEVEIMMRLDHPSIMKLYDYFENQKFVYLVMELCTGGELFDKIIAIKYYDEPGAKLVFRQIMKAVYYCHLNGVCHRDLKPENFIMTSKNDDYKLKLIDFGLSRTFGNNEQLQALTKNQQESLKPIKGRRQPKANLKTKAGTPFYIAPEVLTGNYTEKCDVWSAGVILYVLLCGYPPFFGETNKEILDQVKQGVLDFSGQEWTQVSKSTIDLIRQMIISQDKRLFADEVLRHPFLEQDIKRIDKKIIGDLYQNMKIFSQLSLVQKSIIYFIVRNLSDEKINFLDYIFEFFDDKCTGMINLPSFKAIFGKFIGEPEDQISLIFEKIDIFGIGQLTYSIFIGSAYNPYQLLTNNNLSMFFRLADLDNDGCLTICDLENYLNIQLKYKISIPGKFKGIFIENFQNSFQNGSDEKSFIEAIKL